MELFKSYDKFCLFELRFYYPVNLLHSNRKGTFFIRKLLISFLFLHNNICCGYSLEAPSSGASNEYHNMFLWRNKKNITRIPPLICSYAVGSCRSWYVNLLTLFLGWLSRLSSWPVLVHKLQLVNNNCSSFIKGENGRRNHFMINLQESCGQAGVWTPDPRICSLMYYWLWYGALLLGQLWQAGVIASQYTG